MCSIVRMEKRYVVNLTAEEHAGLTAMTTRGRCSALKVQRARILLKADDGLTDVEIAEEVGVAPRTVERVRERCCLDGLARALDRKPQERPSRLRTLDGRAEAHLLQLACSKPPDGRARWTLALLADKLVELQVVDKVSVTTVHRGLKKKRAEAVASRAVLHPAGRQRLVRAGDGRRSRRLPSAV